MNSEYYTDTEKYTLPRPWRLFPLIRQCSYRTSPILARLGLTPNVITFFGLIAGIASALAFSQGGELWGFIAALLWAVSTLMDYCDGEVARITGKTSRFGRYFDDIADWLVHCAFFIGLGVGALTITGKDIWLLLGIIAAVGTTMNAWMNWWREWSRYRRGEDEPRLPGETVVPANPREYFLYVFRGLFRADFWLLVLLLEIFHATWMLLPVFAIGTQVYWLAGFIKGADRFVQ